MKVQSGEDSGTQQNTAKKAGLEPWDTLEVENGQMTAELSLKAKEQ